MNCFRSAKIFWLLSFCSLFNLLVWGNLSEEWLSSFLMVSDLGSTPMSLPAPFPLPFTTKDVLIIFYAGKKFYFLKFDPFVLQVELRSSPLWDLHDWWVMRQITSPVINGTNTVYFEYSYSHNTQTVYHKIPVCELIRHFRYFRVNTLLSFCKNVDLTYITYISSNPPTSKKITLACIACLCF